MKLTIPSSTKHQSAQGMVEFALVLPLLLLIMLGLMEVGRMLAFYTAVVSASREGARYGSASGHSGDYVSYYQDCQGIRDAAMGVGFFARLEPADVVIRYDHGPDYQTLPFGNCAVNSVGPSNIKLGDRIVVTASTVWEPVVPLVPLQPVTLTSVTRRTILKDVEVEGPPPPLNQPMVYLEPAGFPDCHEENACTYRLKVKLTNLWTQNVSVQLGTTGTAERGQDYSISPFPYVTIYAGQESSEVTINVIDDPYYEDNETVNIHLVAAAQASPMEPRRSSFIIIDNDPMPVVQFMAAAQAHLEGNPSDPDEVKAAVQASLNELSGKPVTAYFQVVGGTAVQGSDYRIETTSIVIPPMSLFSSPDDAHIAFLRDALFEDDETIILQMVGAVGAELHPDPQMLLHTVTILNDDQEPEVYFSPEFQQGGEEVGHMTVDAQLSAVSGKEVVVPYTLSGTATNGMDYTITPNPVTIPVGEISSPITITVIPDGDNTEDSETIILTMGTPQNATKGSPNVHTTTITSIPVLPTIWFTQQSQTVREGLHQIVVTARLSVVSSKVVSLPFILTGTATNGQDYTISSNPLTIPIGAISKDIVINILDDTLYEGDETIIITMGTPVNATPGSPSVHTVTIQDNEAAPRVSFTTSSQTFMEDGGITTITAQLSILASKDVLIPFTIDPGSTATQGSDYTISSSPLVITAGSLSANITVNVIDDSVINEGSETVIVVMGTPTNAVLGTPSTHTVTIIDDDACPTAGMLQVPIGTSSKMSLYISHTSPGAKPVTIDKVTIYWNNALGQKLTTVYWGGTKIFDQNMADSPTLIPDHAPWISGANREVPAGISLRLFEVQFQKALGGSKSDYSLRINFSNTCQIVR
jgi:hypothetical protein